MSAVRKQGKWWGLGIDDEKRIIIPNDNYLGIVNIYKITMEENKAFVTGKRKQMLIDII